MEVINLLSKLNIPIHLSSQIDECLKVLYANRDDLQNQLNLYKQNRRDKQSNENKKSPKVQDEFQLSIGASSSLGSGSGGVNESPKSAESSSRAHNTNDDTKLLQLLDNQSDISSNMDSNYESDNNSINLNLHDSTTATNAVAAGLPSFSLNSDSLEHDAESKQAQIKEFTLMKQKTQTSSDESDVTLTECPPGIELLYKKGKSTNSNSSSSNSDNTITPASPKTPTPANPFNDCCNKLDLDTLTLDDDEKESASPTSTASTITASLDPKRKISRQISDISDGYSSSATPLSASSINNEQPTINPFFPSSNK